MPQGGINLNEDPSLAIKRELFEETNMQSFDILQCTDGWISYDFPENIMLNVFGGKFIGQKQKWFLIDFYGDDNEISVIPPSKEHKREFYNWNWFEAPEIVRCATPFKRELYTKVFKYFKLI